TQRYPAPGDHWPRLLAALPADDPSRSALEGGIARARQNLVEHGAPARRKSLQVLVKLAPALEVKVRPEDSVFIFARAIRG
ncbi:c-type cytochrome biogenesis protein CcmI, partial [Pseudomonas syringae pv. tagetis]